MSSERENLQKRREVLFLSCDLHDFGLHLQADANSEKYLQEKLNSTSSKLYDNGVTTVRNVLKESRLILHFFF